MMRLIPLAVGLLLAAGCKDSTSFDDPAKKGNVTPPTAPTAPQSTGPVVNTGGGGGAVQSVRKAVVRISDANDLKNLHLYIENASGATGRMPDAKTILEDLKREQGAAKLVKAIEEGDLVLTNIKQREGIWAYDKDALTNGGWALTNQAPQRMTAQDLQAQLKMQGN